MTGEEVAVTLAEHGKEIGSLKHRMDEMEALATSINELALSVRELAVNVSTTNNRMERYEDSLRTQGERIGELEKQPSRRLNTITAALITAVISSVVTYIFTLM